METVRLRLAFDHILSKSQKSEGLKRCWILLKPQHETISDLAAYLLHAFDLQNACPNGLILSMEGFVIPPFESTCILKDKDVIRVKKKISLSSEIVEVDDGRNSLEVVEIVDKQPVCPGMNLLANEEFGKESGGYETELDDDVPEEAEVELHVENTSEPKTISKKRKATKDIRRSKRKKTNSASTEKCSNISEDVGNNGHAKKNANLTTIKVDERNDKSSEDMTNVNRRLCHAQENGSGSVDDSTPCGATKFPSRSARRKKAKRQWLREQLKAEKEEQSQRQLGEKINLPSSEKGSCKVSVNGNLVFPKQILPTTTILNGVNFFEETPEKDDDNNLKEDHQQPGQDSDAEDEVVPVVTRPGYIRFESIKKVGADQAMQQSQNSVETFKWNGITSKKKGQKWGTEKASSNKRNYEKGLKTLTIEDSHVHDHIDFDKLAPYASLPKEGDVIAYRLIELSASWTPELSSYRVGKISRYDLESNMIMLVPVPEYPIIPEKDDEASAVLPETYGEDGSLQIKFSSLIDVRIVKHGNLNSTKSLAGRVYEVLGDQDTGTGLGTNKSNEASASASASVPDNEANPWEEISQALDAKKAQLLQEDNWCKPESSGRRPWPYKALRSSALGPTMALLRAQSGL